MFWYSSILALVKCYLSMVGTLEVCSHQSNYSLLLLYFLMWIVGLHIILEDLFGSIYKTLYTRRIRIVLKCAY